jgi:hypothetical protein
MPRIRRNLAGRPRETHLDLVEALKTELEQSHEAGQPVIDEYEFPESRAIRVNVLWDRWEEAESKEFRDRITLAVGLTFPEAEETGLLPFEVFPLLRPGDPVTLAQCQQAMIAEGASTLLSPNKPVLRLITNEEVKRCIERLVEQLPGSKNVWAVTQQSSNDEFKWADDPLSWDSIKSSIPDKQPPPLQN